MRKRSIINWACAAALAALALLFVLIYFFDSRTVW